MDGETSTPISETCYELCQSTRQKLLLPLPLLLPILLAEVL